LPPPPQLKPYTINKTALQGKIPHKKVSRKTKNKMEKRHTEGCIRVAMKTRLEEASWGWRRMEAPFE
jgi:hypothetical protein